MAVFNKQSLLTELMDRIELIKASTQPFLRLNNDQLNYQPAPGKWCISEIFGHLNICNDLYIRQIMTKITKAPEIKAGPGDKYNSGWLGDWVYEKIMPRTDGSVFKLKAPKFLHAVAVNLNGKEVLNHFLQQLDMVDDILRHSGTKDMEGIRIPFSFTRLITLRLGDNLRYLVAHIERHLLQAQKVVSVLPAGLLNDHGTQVLQ